MDNTSPHAKSRIPNPLSNYNLSPVDPYRQTRMTKQESLLEVVVVDPPFMSPIEPSPPGIETAILSPILMITSSIALILPVIPQKDMDKIPVPIIIFRGIPYIFLALSILLAFSGAYGSLLNQDKPKVTKFIWYYSVISMVAALVLLLCALCSTISHQRATS